MSGKAERAQHKGHQTLPWPSSQQEVLSSWLDVTVSLSIVGP